MEGYLVPRCKLAARLCITAQNAVSLEQKAFIKDNVRANGELLLVLIHKQDWKPPGMLSGPVPNIDSNAKGVSQGWTGPNVLKWGVSKEIAAEAGVNLETGIAAVQPQATQLRAVDPRHKDPRLRAGIREPESEERPVANEEAAKAALPPGVTPKAISDLAALFGIGSKTPSSAGVIPNQAVPTTAQLNTKRIHNVPAQTQAAGRDVRQSSHNSASTSGPPNIGQLRMQGVWSQQQQVPSLQPQMAYNSHQGHPLMQQHHKIDGMMGQVPQMVQVPGAQPQSIVFLQGKPQFLSYDPTTRKAIPLDPSTVQYDPTTNQVMLVGALPPGVPAFPTQMVQQFCGSQQGREHGRVLVNSQGIPILVKKAKKEHLGDGDMEDEEEETQRALIGGGHPLMGPMQRSHQGKQNSLW